MFFHRNTSLPIVINQVPITKTFIEPASKDISGNVKITNINPQILNNSDSAQIMNIKENKLNSTNVSLENKHNSISSNIKTNIHTDKTTPDFANIPNGTLSMIDSANINLHYSIDSVKSKETNDNSMNQIQPDSTTSSSSLDIDYILNFDDLNDSLGDLQSVLKQNDKMDIEEEIDFEIKNKNSDEANKSNSMIDFNENWFDMNFSQSTELENSNRQNTFANNETIISPDCSFLESINQIFDQTFPNYPTKGSEQFDHSKHDSVLSHNFHGSTNGAFITQNNYPNQQCHFSANYQGNTFKYNQNGSNNTFSSDPLSELFEDSDFKNSIDFPIMLDS